MNKIPADQQEYFRKNGVGFWETLTPDGSSISNGPTGIINFYISGFTSKTLHMILIALFRELKRIGINWGKLKKEQSGIYKSQVIRIPIIKNNNKYEGAPEIQLSNSTAYHVFHHILQYEGKDDFSMEAEDLKQRIEAAIKDKGWVEKHERPNVTNAPVLPGDEWKQGKKSPAEDDLENPHDDIIRDIGNSMGATMYSFGMSSEHIKRLLLTIWQFTDWALKNGYKDIYVA